jgi:hypothetical protein
MNKIITAIFIVIICLITLLLLTVPKITIKHNEAKCCYSFNGSWTGSACLSSINGFPKYYTINLTGGCKLGEN